MLRLARRLLLVCAGVCLVSCLSPTLPLPPPTRPDVSGPDESGYVRLQGLAAPRVEVFAYNHANQQIAGEVTGSDSSYDFLLQAQVHDTIEVWYSQGTDESQSVIFEVPEPQK